MKKLQKVFVGKGRKPNNFEIIRITLHWDLLEQLVYEMEGEKMITLEVSQMKEADMYDRTHTVYGNIKVDVEETTQEVEVEKPQEKVGKTPAAKKPKAKNRSNRL